MRTRITTVKLLSMLSNAFVTTTSWGQTSYVWTNQNPAQLMSGDLNQGTNWMVYGVPAALRDPSGVPRPDFGPDTNGFYGDEMLFDGWTTGPLTVTQNGGPQVNGAGSGQPYGLRVHVTSNQVAPVTIYSPVIVSAGIRMSYFRIDAGTGSLILGDHITGNCLDMVAGVLNGQIFGFTNNSSTPCVINESVRWRLGGAGVHPFIFDGTGDWVVNNRLRAAASSSILVQKFGSGTMTWTATNNANTFASDQLANPITIGGGTMIWKSSDIVGTINTGNPNIVNNGVLLKYDAPVGAGLIAGRISGTGVLQMNAGTLTLSSSNTYTGATVVSNGTLIINGSQLASATFVYGGALAGAGKLSAPVMLYAGATIAPGAAGGSIGTLTISNDLSIGGNLAIDVNKSLSPSNDFMLVTGVLTNTGAGTLTVSNLGPALTAGDKFTIFSKPLQNGTTLTVTGSSGSWINNLAVDGSITVSSPLAQPMLNFAILGNSIQFSWTGSFKLQAQTNGLTTNWVEYSGGGASPIAVPIDVANRTAFFRLVSEP